MKHAAHLRGVVGIRALSTIAFVILLAVASLAFENVAQAGTPFSTSKSCGYQGGPACPSAAVIVPPMQYYGILDGYQSPYFYNAAEPVAWLAQFMASRQGRCSANGTLGGLTYSSTSYGFTVVDQYNANYTLVQSLPTCGTTLNQTSQVYGNTTVECPTPYTLIYESSPLTGPYCKLESAQPVPNKQTGCPQCSAAGGLNSGGANAGTGGLPKGDPVDVSNANLYLSETDYVGAGGNPVKFVRSYNQLGAAAPTTSGQSAYLGPGWSATYFQTLVPVTVTDSTTTYNSVYAYRPDGRVLTFNKYNGVYSPDGDVAESLIQTSSGWQYQSADDTIETYNASGQLLSSAKRGHASITVNYASGSGAGDPPTSVSDPFGHTLQFSYVKSSSGVNQLASITDPAGHVISYSFNSNGQLGTVTQTDNTTRSYSYAHPADAWLSGVTDEASVQYETWTYNSSNQPATFQNAGGVNSYSFTYSTSGSGGSVKVQDPLGNTRTYNQSLIWGAYHTTSSSAPCTGCSEDAGRVFDANGNITSRTDFNSNVTNYVYNEQTNLETSRTEAYGTSSARTITTQWDANWRRPDLITEPNRTTAFTYDSMGNVLTKTVTDTTVTPNVSRTWTIHLRQLWTHAHREGSAD